MDAFIDIQNELPHSQGNTRPGQWLDTGQEHADTAKKLQPCAQPHPGFSDQYTGVDMSH